MPPLSSLSLPGVWHASELDTAGQPVLGSGDAVLDAQLPGGGWPLGSLTDILQPQQGLHEWRLLLPVLRTAARNGTLVLVGSPHQPHLPALAGLGIAAASVLVVEARTPAERLWSAEQALRCHAVSALMAWLPQTRPEQLRRLQLASQRTGGEPLAPLVFAFRPLAAQHESSPAPLRLSLGNGPGGTLQVRILKRRGPALDDALALHAPLPVHVTLRHRGAAVAASAPRTVPITVVETAVSDHHAVDRPRTALPRDPATASRLAA